MTVSPAKPFGRVLTGSTLLSWGGGVLEKSFQKGSKIMVLESVSRLFETTEQWFKDYMVTATTNLGRDIIRAPKTSSTVFGTPGFRGQRGSNPRPLA